jgi:formylglycine-generating enzyme required for sulfatase activity
MKLVWILPGEFPMGSPDSEIARGDNEHQRRVRIREGCYLSAYEVMPVKYQRVTGDNPSLHSPNGPFKKKVYGVLRGGSCTNRPAYCCSAIRLQAYPARRMG